jgi:hypothetical protein
MLVCIHYTILVKVDRCAQECKVFCERSMRMSLYVKHGYLYDYCSRARRCQSV